MKNFLPDLLDIFKRTYQDWKEDHASRLAVVAPMLYVE